MEETVTREQSQAYEKQSKKKLEIREAEDLLSEEYYNYKKRDNPIILGR